MKKYIKYLVFTFILSLFFALGGLVASADNNYVAVAVGNNLEGKMVKFEGGTFTLTSEEWNSLNNSINREVITTADTVLLEYFPDSATSFDLKGGEQDTEAMWNNVVVNFSYSGTTLTVTPSNTAPFIFTGCNEPIDSLGILGTYDIDILFINTTPVGTPILDGEAGIISNVDSPLSVTQIKSGITAVDNEDGDISHLIQVGTDNYTANKNTLGTYTITFTVTDTSSNTATLTVTVMVVDVTDPVIVGPATYQANISTLTNVSTIQALLTVTDNYSTGQALVLRVKTNDYNANYNRVGIYNIVFEAEDESGNTKTHTVAVTVRDDVAPTFTGPETILKAASETLTTNAIKALYTANDNVDGNITSRITIQSDGYTGHGATKGVYTIVFVVADIATNSTTHTLTITVEDDIPPVFFVDNYFIKISQMENLTNEQIVNLLVVAGKIDNTVDRTITFMNNSYTGNEENVGMYPITIKVTSTNGEEDIINIAVQVLEATNGDGDIVLPGTGTIATWLKAIGWFGLPNWSLLLIGGVLVLVLVGLKGKKGNYYRSRR